MTRIYADVDGEWLLRYDDLWKAAGYVSRVEAVRDALRQHTAFLKRQLTAQQIKELEEAGVK